MTESALDMLRSLQLVRAACDAITLIATVPGTGETEALWHFRNTVCCDTIIHSAVAKEDDTPWGAACQLIETLGIETLGIEAPTDAISVSRQRAASCLGKPPWVSQPR